MLNKAIDSGKEHRKPYKGAKAVCCSCRNHGICEWCRNNRLHSSIVRELRTYYQLKELLYK